MSEEKKLEKNRAVISRRCFLLRTGVIAGGLLAAGGITGVFTTKAEAAAPVPWPYVKLDTEVVRKKGFDPYYEAGCCYGAGKALVTALREALPESPWHDLPLDMFKFGAGGALSWGTLCGALNGSLAVMNLAAPTYINSIGQELIGWYTNFPFPTTILDPYSSYKNQVTTVAHSPLCHNSVSIWCNTAGYTVNSPQKKARCAKLTGDVAAKTAQILNEVLIDRTFVATFNYDADTQNCMNCHTGTTSMYDNEQGKMECKECHAPHL